MPRDIVLGNGSMLVNIDRRLNVRDLYFPGVGLQNHISGHRNKLGVWSEGNFSWTDDLSWQIKLGYSKDTLISTAEAKNNNLQIVLDINDSVHYRKNFLLKKITVFNNSSRSREIRVFFSHDFTINESGVGDTAIFEPTRKCICHYKRDRYFLINGFFGNEGIYQYSIGTKRFGWAEGTWRDAEDGILEQNPICHGSIDSVISFRSEIGAGESTELYYWIAVGEDIYKVWELNEFILERGAEKIFGEISSYWNAWVRRKDHDFFDLPEQVVDMYHRSLLVIRTQTDNDGAILAANDSDVLLTYPDHYSYVWPRDGAMVAYALDYAGYPHLSARFYEFCAKIISEGGFFLHKYNADGTVGSSWHPWWKEGRSQLPIQEDETALVLFALGAHYKRYRDIELIESLYPTLIKKAADFLVYYRDPVTKLPMLSFDLWEERRGIFSFTCSAVYGALKAAADFAALFKDTPSEEKYSQAAQELHEAMIKYLYSPENGRFLRGIYPNETGGFDNDYTLDSSMYGLFEFGAFPASDISVEGTMEAVIKDLWVKTEIGGLARYTNDYYFKKSDDIENVPGNPWVICTLWLAEWYADKAQKMEELEISKNYIEWAVRYALPSGVLPEQVHPYTGEDLSVSPLTWSHSTFVLAVEKYLEKFRLLSGKCN